MYPKYFKSFLSFFICFLLISSIHVKGVTSNLEYDNFLVNQRIQDGSKFIMNNLYDGKDGGFYISCESDGNNPITLKYSSFQAFSALAFYNLYLNLHDQLYWNLAESAIDFLIGNLWDTSYLGFYHCSDRSGNISNVESGKLPTIKDSAYQSWAILALVKSYELKNNKEILPLINQTLTFLFQKLWDENNSIFYKWTERDGSNPLKIVLSYYNFWIITALIKAYRIFYNSQYMEYVNKTVNYLYANLWNSTSQYFYYSGDSYRTPIDKSNYLIVQSAALIALNELYLETRNITHYLFIQNITKSIIDNLWDSRNNGFFDLIFQNTTQFSKNPSIQAAAIYAYINLNLSNTTQISYQNYTIATLNFILKSLWDSVSSGYFYEYLPNGTSMSSEKWLIDQIWVLYALSFFDSDGLFSFNLLIIIPELCIFALLFFLICRNLKMKSLNGNQKTFILQYFGKMVYIEIFSY